MVADTNPFLAVSPKTFTSFGALLLFLRRRARLRQRDLAIAIGYSEAQIGRLENDQRLPDVATVMAQFVPALGIEQEPEFAQRLVELAREARRAGDSTETIQVLPGSPEALPPATAEPCVDAELLHQSTPLLGRETELARLAALVPTNRCITLVGPGGVGKTRLAIEAALRHADHFANGMCAVALAGVVSPHILAPTLAQAFGLSAATQSDIVSQLQAYLRDKHMLIVLDNMEQLVEGADLLARLLAHAPRIHILATSRERLQLRGEITLEVAGLPLPSRDADERTLRANPAVSLFCSLAQRLRGGEVFSHEHLYTAARICRLVEGFPLAIELAAGWAHLLSFDEIERELRQALDFLQTGMRDLPPRHRSLRAAFTHSWDMLTPLEQQALQRLSVFRGSFGREAADHILHADYTDSTRPIATLHVLGSLADKSLLQRVDGAGASRFSLHELIRQYAAEHLQSQPTEAKIAHASHSDYYLSLLDSQRSFLRGPTQSKALTTLAHETEQIRAALQWAIEEGDIPSLYRAMQSLPIWFEWSYMLEEGIVLFQQISSRMREITPAAEHADAHQTVFALALTQSAWFSFVMSHHEAAFAQAHEALGSAQQGGLPLALGCTQFFLGAMSTEIGETAKGRSYLLAALRAFERHGDAWFVARALYRLASLCYQQGDYVSAWQLLSIGINELRPIGDPRALAMCLNRLGITHTLLGRHAEAQACFQESLVLCSSTRDQRSIASAMYHLGSVAQYQNDHATARYFFQECLSIFTELNDRNSAATVLALAGYSEVVAQDYAEARKTFAAAWAIVRDSDVTTILLSLIVGCAALDLAENRSERAVEALALVVDHSATEQQTRDRAAHLLRHAEHKLTPYQFTAAQARGRTGSLAFYRQAFGMHKG